MHHPPLHLGQHAACTILQRMWGGPAATASNGEFIFLQCMWGAASNGLFFLQCI